MMTSVAGGYRSPSPSPSPASAEVDADADVAALRLKRPPPLSSDTCKKRRKQSTPIRISSSDLGDLPLDLGLGLCYEGKMPAPLQSPEPEESDATAPTATVKVEHSPSPAEPSSPSLPVNLSGGQNFPPWLSDVQPKSNDWLNANASNNFYVPVGISRVTSAPHSQQQPQPPIRIFNPEAYCELCNKEFCNKYFLKTHKANKHRIYTDPPTSDVMSVGLPPVNVPSFTAMKKTMAIPVPVPVAVPIPIVQSIPETPNSALKNPTHSLVDFLNIFCDICGKGFSNKLMLKTHRVSVHAAVDSEPVTESDPLGITVPLDSPVKEERERDSDLGEIAALPDKDNLIYKSDHFKDDQIINHLSTVDQDEITESQQQNRDRETLEFPINRPRRLGIMNPEAFCEICCKEYCNKYFLRTHKMKRHGILIPDENSKDNQKDFKLELSISNNWYQIQTSPLNLIMGEQNTNSSGSCERKSSPSANENECEICGMRFQTLYLAQLHFATAHSQTKQTNSNEEFSAALSANNNDKQASDSISEDLQKLQTMILQLNELDVSKVGVTNTGSNLCSCSMCGKEFENRYYLHAHLMTEHGVLLENNPTNNTEMDHGSEMSPEANLDNQSQQKNTCNATSVSTTSVSMIPSSLLDKKDDSNGFMGSEKMRTTSNGNAISERRSSLTMTPANSYCEICNKELCNKYFMKTHMQRMHGIEIENGAQIGGVVCNICNKELCSKYFLRVHKHNTHGIVQENIGGTSNQTHTRSANLELDQPVSGSGTTSAPPSTDVGSVTDSALKLSDLSDLSNRYFTHFTEVCTICSRRFRSTKWLKAHLLGDHGKAGTDKWNELEMQLQSFGQQRKTSSPTLRIPNGVQENTTQPEAGMQNVLSSIFGTDEANVKQYHCSFCSFSTPVLAFLFVHERSHSRSINMGDVSNTSNSGNNTTATAPPSAISPLYCAVCNQSFRQPEQLHHHIVQQHTFLSFFGHARQQTSSQEIPNPKVVEEDHKCSKCYACGRGKELDVFMLKDVCKQKQLPATYALPQSQLKAKYTMQAFLMDEPLIDVLPAETTNGDEEQSENGATSSDRRFAPSIVFLPVLEKLTAPLTVSFTLTPA